MDHLKEIDQCVEEIRKIQSRMQEISLSQSKLLKGKYRFATKDAELSLEDLFGDKEDLIIIHNMGASCVYCTSYADGLNGILGHLEDRASVVLLSPDPVEVQLKFACERGWNYRMISADGVGWELSEEVGLIWKDEGFHPGFITLHKSDEGIELVSVMSFDPGDAYCPIWPIMSLLKDGANEWHPKFTYDS